MIVAVPPPLSLYVHLPWCVRKCPYCDFNSHPRPQQGIPESAYINALLDDLEFAAAGTTGRPLVSVFFGGGTPSLVGAHSIAAVLERVDALFGRDERREVTLEANPGTVERGRFGEYRSAGVNRISLGAQSFDAQLLEALGRIHSPADIDVAVEELHAAGIENFNLDLMYALPQQSIRQAIDDLERALALGPAHLSCYQLTLEPGTAFGRRPPPLPSEDDAFAMQLECQARLDAAGLRQYEVSAYAIDGRRCVHNLNYWEFGDYLGVGAGAHGKLTDPGRGAVTRTTRVRQPARYIAAGSGPERIAELRTVTRAELSFEFALNALRLVDGFDLRLFEARTGLPASMLQEPISEAVARGLLAAGREGRCTPTDLGRRFLNDLQGLFLPRAEGGRSRPGGNSGLARADRIG
jgi:putative oxygen-independent coproporphyrinogen III oxidase